MDQASDQAVLAIASGLRRDLCNLLDAVDGLSRRLRVASKHVEGLLAVVDEVCESAAEEINAPMAAAVSGAQCEAEPVRGSKPAGDSPLMVLEVLRDRARQRGVDLDAVPKGNLSVLPQLYTITIEGRPEEDRRTSVALAPLHRALMTIDNVRDVALVSYVHGVATVNVEAEGEIEGQAIEMAIGRTMHRPCSVVARDGQRMLIRITS